MAKLIRVVLVSLMLIPFKCNHGIGQSIFLVQELNLIGTRQSHTNGGTSLVVNYDELMSLAIGVDSDSS